MWRSKTHCDFLMDKLGAFASLTSLGFACWYDVCVLVLEPSFVQLSIVDIKPMCHLSYSTHVACFDISLRNMLRLPVNWRNHWVQKSRLTRPCKSRWNAWLIKDQISLADPSLVEVIVRSAVLASKSVVWTSVYLRCDWCFWSWRIWRHDCWFGALILSTQIALKLLPFLYVISFMYVKDQLCWIDSLNEAL